MKSLPSRILRKAGRIITRKVKPLRSASKAAIVGCGQISSTHIQGFEDCGESMVIAVSDVHGPALAGSLDQWSFLRGYADYRQMLNDTCPDIVSVCTWPQSHAEIAAACAHSGVRGVLCEKPLALSMGDINEMISICSKRGVKLACGHQYRFHPVFIQAANAISSGKLGTVTSVSGMIRGSLANNGPHLIDTIRFVLGDLPTLTVEATCERPDNLHERGLPCEATAKVNLVFEGGVVCSLVTGIADAAAFEIKIIGTAGELEVTPSTLIINGKTEPVPDDANNECRRRQFAEFVRWVRGKSSHYAADAKSSASTAEIVLAGYESIRTGEAVRLPLTNHGNVISETFPSTSTRTYNENSKRQSVSYSKPLALAGGPRSMPKWFSGSPVMGWRELRNVASVVLSKELNRIGGWAVKQLEREFADAYGSPYAVASTSGTAAVHVALGALNLDPCDEVITTPLTDMGSVIPILACNCIPIFADVDPITGMLTAESIAQRITSRTRAVVLVHLFGRPANLGSIVQLLKEHGIALIEDCSQAHFAEYQGRKVGTFGDFGCFSLQQSKQITCGDGGLTIVNRRDLYESASLFTDKGWRRGQGKTGHLRFGMNYRMTELQGAVALAQLRRLPELIANRRRMADELTARLQGIPSIEMLPAEPANRSSWWKFLFRLKHSDELSCQEFYNALLVEGVRISARYLARPLFDEPMLREPNTYGSSGYPFTATEYRAPTVEEFPGFREFNDRWYHITWSSRVKPVHVQRIHNAIAKVTKELKLKDRDSAMEKPHRRELQAV